MQNTGVKLAEIKRKLSRLPGSKLDEVNTFVGFLLSRHKEEGRKNIHMRGIWAGKGFEKIDVQKEIKSLRKDISKSSTCLRRTGL
jgi:ribosomal protein L19